MKKVITLVLAIALVLTSVVAIAETVEAPAAPKGTPNVASFATMKTKYDERNHIITITLSKPVDRLLIVWAEKGAEPEELAVGEDLTATALTWGHKYMPGTKQNYVTWSNATVTQDAKWFNVGTSEEVYKVDPDSVKGAPTNPVAVLTTKTYAPTFTFDAPVTDADFDYTVADYKAKYPCADYEIVKPHYVQKDTVSYDKFGNAIPGTANVEADGKSNVTNNWVKYGTDPVNAGDKVFVPGYIRGVDTKVEFNNKYSTVVATPADTAFMTVQGEWAVYYNRAGKIVGIEYFEGQF